VVIEFLYISKSSEFNVYKSTRALSGPEVLFKTCVAMKFVDDDDDDDTQRTTLGDGAFPVAAARAWNAL